MEFNPFGWIKDRCPKCRKVMDSAMPVDGTSQPQPGDYSVCISCAALLVFKDDRRVRLLTLDEMETMDFPTVSMLLKARAQVLLLRGGEDRGLI